MDVICCDCGNIEDPIYMDVFMFWSVFGISKSASCMVVIAQNGIVLDHFGSPKSASCMMVSAENGVVD